MGLGEEASPRMLPSELARKRGHCIDTSCHTCITKLNELVKVDRVLCYFYTAPTPAKGKEKQE